MSTWYLLYDGHSADGRGTASYIGRTTDENVAEEHAKKCDKDPYCTGFVNAFNDTEQWRHYPVGHYFRRRDN